MPDAPPHQTQLLIVEFDRDQVGVLIFEKAEKACQPPLRQAKEHTAGEVELGAEPRAARRLAFRRNEKNVALHMS